MNITWRSWEGAVAAFENGRVRAVIRKRVDGPVWNLHLQDLPWPKGLFPYSNPETAKKHAPRWLERHPSPSAEEIRRRTDRLFAAPESP